jgi:peptidoglycan/xylan/chitin deacetylase (PgdA/CDA1 family)
VNFYTLTFKKKILISLFAIFASFILLDIALAMMVKVKSTKVSFIDDKFSKITHYQHNNPDEKDIVFVGSSRTFFHIATNTFKEAGLNVYNFGISGAQFEDYPTIIDKIIKHPPKRVIISLNVSRLYDTLNISNLPTLQEAAYYYDIDKEMFASSLLQWAINLHQFLVHSQTIYYKIQEFYTRFEPKKASIKRDKPTIDYDTRVGCHIFDKQNIGGKHLTLKCTNGDGIRIGNHTLPSQQKPQDLKHFNPKSIAYLQKMVDTLNRHNIPVTFILQPILHNPYHYDAKAVSSAFKNVKIIDLTNLHIDDKYWADEGHLNNEGRIYYSQYLSDIIQ